MDFTSLLGTAFLLIGVMSVLLGLVILRENPSARLSRVTSLMLIFAGIGTLLGAGALLFQDPTAPDTGRPGTVNFAYLWEFFFPTLLLFAASFPRESPLLRRHGWGELMVYVPHTIHFFLMFFASIWGTSFGLERLAERASFFGGFFDLLRVLLRLFFTWHRHLFSLVNLTYVGASIFLIARNLSAVRNAGVRNQLRVILVGMGAGVILYSFGAPLNVLLGLHLRETIASALLVSALGVCSGTIAYAIVRHRFLDARWIVRRTILYALASLVIVGLYLEIARQINRGLAQPLRIPPAVLDWIALVVPLVLFQPIMTRLEEGFEGLLLRGRRELRSVVDRLSRQLGSTLDFDSQAEALARELPESLGASGAAILRKPTGDASWLPYRSVAATGFESELLARLEGLAQFLPEPVEVGRPLGAREWVEAHQRASQEGVAVGAILRAHAPHLTFELRHGVERLGLMAFGPKASGMRYSSEEISALSTLANQAGVAMKNYLLYQETLSKAVLEEELALARKIQQTFLPSRFPSHLPFEIHGLNLPSKQVGGDYFDLIPLDGGRYAIAIADVSGKGVGAALLASMLQASLRTLLRDNPPIARVVHHLNVMLCESTGPDQFVTFFAAIVDPLAMTLRYCNAGHNYPLHVTSKGKRLLDNAGLILGVDSQATYCEEEFSIGRGDVVLLYTDGVTEARTPEGVEFGEERLLEFLEDRRSQPAERIVAEIRDEVLRFCRTGEAQDDMTLLCLRVPEPPRRLDARLPSGEDGKPDPGSFPLV